MEKVTTIFKGDNREITINFSHNQETGNLDYNVVVEPPFVSDEEIKNGSLEVFLANTFLGALMTPSEMNNYAEDTNTDNSSGE